jgi:hypothetical protein
MSLQTDCRVVNQASARKTDLQQAPEKRWSHVPTGSVFQNREFSPNHNIVKVVIPEVRPFF